MDKTENKGKNAIMLPTEQKLNIMINFFYLKKNHVASPFPVGSLLTPHSFNIYFTIK